MNTIWDCELVALDIETTGLRSGHGDRVIELGLVRGKYGQHPQSWSSLVQPNRSIRTVAIHGIHEAMLKDAPVFSEIVPTLLPYLQDAVLVLHHARVDLAFLRTELARCQQEPLLNPILDTLGLARHIPTLKSRSLHHLCQHFKTALPSHRAGPDALATYELCWTLLDKLDPHHTLSIDQAIEAGKQASSRDRHQVRARLEAAMQQQTELLILYHSTQESTQRRIRVEHINNKEVHAWCFLRQDRRVFRLDRIEILTE